MAGCAYAEQTSGCSFVAIRLPRPPAPRGNPLPSRTLPAAPIGISTPLDSSVGLARSSRFNRQPNDQLPRMVAGLGNDHGACRFLLTDLTRDSLPRSDGGHVLVEFAPRRFRPARCERGLARRTRSFDLSLPKRFCPSRFVAKAGFLTLSCSVRAVFRQARD